MTARLVVTMLAFTAVLLGVLVVPLGIESARSERRELQARVERDATTVASLAEDALERGARPPDALTRLAAEYLDETGGRILVVDRSGTSLVDPSSSLGRDFSSRPEVAAALAGDIASGTRRSRTLGAGLLYVAVPIASGGVVHGATRVTYPTSTADARVRRTWLARWASRPLVRLEAAAHGVESGNLSARAPVDGPPEVRAVAESFNAMIGRVETMLSDQQAFVADASHQLRTPLTALRLRLENLASDAPAATSRDVEAAAAEVDRLAEIVDGLLVLARADEGHTDARPIDLRGIARERVDAWQALAVERDVALRADLDGPLVAVVGVDRLEQVLDNLLSNALEALDGPGTVEMLGTAGDATVELRVRDDGPGLDGDERAHAFDRFWRGRTTPGSGLGLPIARRLVEADGGTLELEAAPTGGLDAVVRYPRR